MKKVLFLISLMICLCSYSQDISKAEPRLGNPYVTLYQFHKKYYKDLNIYYYDTRIFVESDKGQRDGAVCRVWDMQAPGTVPLYLYAQSIRGYYYDTNAFAQNKGRKIGVVCYIYTAPSSGLVPLYEFKLPGNEILYYYDTREYVEPNKGNVTRIVGYVVPN